MRGLFTKIFLGFWIAQSLTFFISTLLILRHHFVRPNEILEVLDATLPIAAKAAATAYESGGCPALQQFAGSLHQAIYLADSAGRYLCTRLPSPEAEEALKAADANHGVHPSLAGDHYLWSMTTQSAAGGRYLFLLSRPHTAATFGVRDLLHFATPQLPIGIVLFGATTFIMVLLLVRPIGRLRSAARHLANGELATRVPEPDGEERLFGGDEIQGLVHDFNHMAEQLEQLVGAQKMLVRDVSHELRSPLARLSVALELAREEAPEVMTEHLQRIEREAGRLNLLIGQLLRLSSMESTNASTHMELFHLQNLIDDLLPDAEYEAQQRSCTVRVLGHCDCMIRGNPELIYRAIENVLRNAIRYSGQESIVDLAVHCEERAGARAVTLDISDRGPGVPESELEHIFRPFYRLDAARERDTGGFGVGLAIADRAVRLHHGEVRANNRPDGGLVVSLRLPCEK
jgi:two-component system, OmpR family, sensor histidine kinase CpxA